MKQISLLAFVSHPFAAISWGEKAANTLSVPTTKFIDKTASLSGGLCCFAAAAALGYAGAMAHTSGSFGIPEIKILGLAIVIAVILARMAYYLVVERQPSKDSKLFKTPLSKLHDIAREAQEVQSKVAALANQFGLFATQPVRQNDLPEAKPGVTPDSV